MKTSKHAARRVRKRIGIKKKTVDSMCAAAFSKGLTHTQVVGRLSKYFDHLFLSHKTANNIRIYANYVWIFGGTYLITVFPVPGKLRSAAISARKKSEIGI